LIYLVGAAGFEPTTPSSDDRGVHNALISRAIVRPTTAHRMQSMAKDRGWGGAYPAIAVACGLFRSFVPTAARFQNLTGN